MIGGSLNTSLNTNHSFFNSDPFFDLRAQSSGPALFADDPKAKERMVAYTKETTPNVSESDMIKLVKEGEEIARRIFNPNVDSSKTPPTKDEVVSFMWYLMAKAAKQEQEYEKGVIVCTDSDADKVFDFLMKCGETENEIHSHDRISSHFKNRVEGLQYGIDILKGTTKAPLPVNLQAILFAKLSGGGVFIKMEEVGFPVKGLIKAIAGDPKYQHFKAYAPKAILEHGYNWAKHIITGPDESSPRLTRRESKKMADFDDVKAAFTKSMKALSASDDEIAEAIEEGVDYMQTLLDRKSLAFAEISDLPEENSPLILTRRFDANSPKMLKIRRVFNSFHETQKGESGTVKRQGSEVMLRVNPN